MASASRTTGAEWKRIPTGKPSARCWNAGSAVIIDGAYRGRDARGEAALRDEVLLELLRVDAVALGVADSFGGR